MSTTQRAVRKCTFTKRPISPQDRSSVVFTIARVDDEGRATGDVEIITVSGSLRKDGAVDSLLYNEIAKRA